MLVWEHSKDDNHYQVRRAGHSLRLYRNGVFHSQYNGRRLLNGGVWDMLWLPLWFRPGKQRQRVLMLGVGAGAAAKKLLDSGFSGSFTGIELDPVHLHIAKRFTGLTSGKASVKLHTANAFQWLKRYRGPAFDVIIDDLYGELDGEPLRQLGGGFSQSSWLATQQKHLKHGGLLLANCDSRKSLNDLLGAARAGGSLQAGVVFSVPHYENRVALLSSEELDTRAYWERLTEQFGHSAVKQIRQAGLRPRRL